MKYLLIFKFSKKKKKKFKIVKKINAEIFSGAL